MEKYKGDGVYYPAEPGRFCFIMKVNGVVLLQWGIVLFWMMYFGYSGDKKASMSWHKCGWFIFAINISWVIVLCILACPGAHHSCFLQYLLLILWSLAIGIIFERMSDPYKSPKEFEGLAALPMTFIMTALGP